MNSNDDRTHVKAVSLTEALEKPEVQQAVANEPEGAMTEVRVNLDIVLESYDAVNSSLKLDVTPRYEVIQKQGEQETKIDEGVLDDLEKLPD